MMSKMRINYKERLPKELLEQAMLIDELPPGLTAFLRAKKWVIKNIEEDQAFLAFYRIISSSARYQTFREQDIVDAWDGRMCVSRIRDLWDYRPMDAGVWRLNAYGPLGSRFEKEFDDLNEAWHEFEEMQKTQGVYLPKRDDWTDSEWEKERYQQKVTVSREKPKSYRSELLSKLLREKGIYHKMQLRWVSYAEQIGEQIEETLETLAELEQEYLDYSGEKYIE